MMALHSRRRFQSWLPALFDGEFDWDFLKPAWEGTKIEPMDFDAVIERRGNFLIFETKIPGKGIDEGQSITLTDQWRKGSTIFVLSGKSPSEIEAFCMYKGIEKRKNINVGEREMTPCNAYDVVFNARRWFCWASGWDIPGRESWDNELWQWDYDRS